MSPYAIGIDIGVTNIKSVCIAEDGRELARQQVPTHADSPDWPKRVAEHVDRLLHRLGRTKLLGIAAPGLAAADGRRISWMQGRLGEVEGLEWISFLSWPGPVPVLNDAQAALVGEVWKGSAIGAKNAILITLGTGVGGAILCDGRVLKGHLGRAGHLGHISLDPDGVPDVTNCPGSLEFAIGNYTLRERSGGAFQTTHDLVRFYECSDEKAAAIWLRSIKALAAAIASFINIVDPEVIIIGGGIASAGDALLKPLAEFLDRFEWRPHGQKAKLVLASLGEFAGAFGAAWNAIQHSKEQAR